MWDNDYSTIAGLNDQVPVSRLTRHKSSLKLVTVDSIGFCVSAPGKDFGKHKRRVQGRFRLARSDYHLWVTDPMIESKYLRMENGEYEAGPAYLTISLGEPFNNHSQKLIAAIIEK